jgi:O-antigen/teichoic acid export membrane protein
MNDSKSAADAHRLILRGSASAAFGFVIRLGARLLFLWFAARLFGATLFGAYSVAVAVVEVGVIVGGLGTKRTLFKLLDEDATGRPPIHIVLDAAAAVLAASLVIAALVMGVVGLLPHTGNVGETETALLFIAPMVAGQALLDLFGAATRWRHRMRYDVVGRSICEPYGAIAALLAAWALGFEEVALLASYWAGTLAALAYTLWGVRRCYGSFALGSYRLSVAEIRAIVRGNSLATLNDFLNGGFARLDIYFVGLLLGEAPAGIYGMARQLRTPLRQIRQSFDGLLAPLIARTLAESTPAETRLAAASATRLILAIQLPMLITLAAIGRPLLAWIGPEFVAGYYAMVMLAAAETIQGAFGVSDLILLYRRPSLVLAVTCASAAMNFVGGWLLVLAYGIDGAALAVLLAWIAGAIVRRTALRRALGAEVSLLHSAGPVAAAMVAALVAASLLQWGGLASPAGNGLAAAGALAVYTFGLWLWLSLSGQTLKLANFRMA